MFRIDVPTADAVLHAPAAVGTPGYFNNGNPGLLIPSTVVDMDWLNSVQEELVAIATALGAPLSKTTRNQCLTAIQAMIQQQTGNYAVDTGAADVYVGAYAPAITAYVDGMVLRLFVANTNITTTPTFNAGTPGAKGILRDDGTAIVAGDLPANSYAAFEYRVATTKWYLLSVTQNVAAAAIQAQSPNYQPAGGTANAITATFAPAIGAHITGAPLRIKIGTQNTGAVTLNPGPGAVAAQTFDGQAFVEGELKVGMIVTFTYDGAAYRSDIIRSTAVPGASGLTITNDATTPDTKIAVTADFAVLLDSVFRPLMATGVNISTAGAGAINLGVVGANGIDAGAQAASTWYNVFIIGKPDGTIAGLASLSATAPTMPAGYTFKLRVGAMRSGGATTLLRTKQFGNRARYIVTAGTNTILLPQMVVTTNNAVRVNIPVAAFVPPTATFVAVVASATNGPNNSMIVAPSQDVGYTNLGSGVATNPPPVATFGGGGSSVEQGAIAVELAIESANIAYSTGGGSIGNTAISAYGWTDKVNAG